MSAVGCYTSSDVALVLGALAAGLTAIAGYIRGHANGRQAERDDAEDR